MNLDLIVVETKKNKIKIIIIVILTILFIILFSMLGMYYAKLYKAKIIAKNIRKSTENINLINKDVNVSEQNQQSIHIEDKKHEQKKLLPVYSEDAKKGMKNIYNENEKIAYLTFDDGPSQAVTPLILDLLKEENIKVTFFVLGNNVDKYPELLKREYLEGHYIANHGYSHNYSKLYVSAENVLSEYEKTEKSIQKAIENNEYSSHLFRFPGGYSGGKYAKIKKDAGKLLNENNISYIDWNVITGDAQGANTKEKIMKNIQKYTNNKGSIVVLMHDASNKILTYETLKDVINYLKDQGYTFDNFYSIMQ